MLQLYRLTNTDITVLNEKLESLRRIIEELTAILNDENRIVPVSTLLEGEYGEKDVYAGVPTILNRTGASDVLEIHMTPGELARFKESVQLIREYTGRIMEIHKSL